MAVKLDIVAQADASSVADLGKTMDDVAAGGTQLGDKIQDALEKSEAAARPTNTEFKALARSLDDLATASGKTKTEALDDLKRAAEEAGTELKQGTLEALERLAAQGPRDIDKVRDAVNDLKRAGADVEIDLDTDQPLTAVQDLNNEIKASLGETLGEMAGSWAESGASAESAIEGIVEVAAEAAQALPGPAALAGSAFVAGAAAAYGAWNARLKAIAAEAGDMYQDLLESGREFLSDQYFQNKLGEFWDPMGESYDKNIAQIDILEKLGVPTDEAALALIGYGDVSDEVYGKVVRSLDDAQGGAGDYLGALKRLGPNSQSVLGGVKNDIEDNKKSFNRAQDSVRGYNTSIKALPDKATTNVTVKDNGSIRNMRDAVRNFVGQNHGSIGIGVNANLSQASYDIAQFRVGQQNLPITIGFRGA